MKIKDFIILGIEHDIDDARKDIRKIKKHISMLYDFKKHMSAMPEEDLKEYVRRQPELLEKYEELKKAVEDKERAEILKMAKEGKLKEIFYGKDGKPIDTDSGEEVGAGTDLSSPLE